jgi:hypothetical protein
MTEYRQFGTAPTSAPRDSRVSTAVLDISQVSTAALDVSHVHTQELDPPEYLRPLLPPEAFSSPSPAPSFPPAPRSPPPLHAAQHSPLPLPLPLSPPLVPPPLERDPQTAAIAEHLRAAVRLNRDAYQLLDALKVCSAEANAAAQRWFTHVTNAQKRTPRQSAAYADLEAQVLTFSRQLASLRQRHAACLAQARAHEDAARFIHSQHAPVDPRR